MNPPKPACDSADTFSSSMQLLVSIPHLSSTPNLLKVFDEIKFLKSSFELNLNVSGEKMGNIFAIFPIMYLSGGTCVALIIMGGSTMKQFYLTVCGGAACSPNPPTTAEWYLIFTCAAVVLSQLPNLNSIAGVSLIGAITAVTYCTMIWIVSVAEGRLSGVSYNPVSSSSEIGRIFDVLNALGIIAFAFRGHNLILEIQVCQSHSLPSFFFFCIFFFYYFLYLDNTSNGWKHLQIFMAWFIF